MSSETVHSRICCMVHSLAASLQVATGPSKAPVIGAEPDVPMDVHCAASPLGVEVQHLIAANAAASTQEV